MLLCIYVIVEVDYSCSGRVAALSGALSMAHDYYIHIIIITMYIYTGRFIVMMHQYMMLKKLRTIHQFRMLKILWTMLTFLLSIFLLILIIIIFLLLLLLLLHLLHLLLFLLLLLYNYYLQREMKLAELWHTPIESV